MKLAGFESNQNTTTDRKKLNAVESPRTDIRQDSPQGTKAQRGAGVSVREATREQKAYEHSLWVELLRSAGVEGYIPTYDDWEQMEAVAEVLGYMPTADEWWKMEPPLSDILDSLEGGKSGGAGG